MELRVDLRTYKKNVRMAKAQLELKLVRLCLDPTLCSPPPSIVGVIFLPPADYTCPKTGRIEYPHPALRELSTK